MFKGTMTKWPVQKLTQGTTQKLLQHHVIMSYIYVIVKKKLLSVSVSKTAKIWIRHTY